MTIQKIGITGASGFIGHQIIPRLEALGFELILLSRAPVSLQSKWPNLKIYHSDAAKAAFSGCDIVLHLAALNNNSKKSLADFRLANVDFAIKMANAAKESDVRFFLDFSSTHALDEKEESSYGISKRESKEALDSIDGLRCHHLILPAVYGEVFAGRLSIFNRLPPVIVKPLFMALAALKPTVHIDKIAEWFTLYAKAPTSGTTMLSDTQTFNPMYHFMRLIIDISFALLVIVFLWWLLLFIWVVIKSSSGGPGIFAQERIGQFGHEFTCYKFRTMYQETKQAGTHEVTQASVTKIGRFLRKTKLDELPQVINILKGEISLIGPRPCLPSQTDLVSEREKRGVLQIKPGISGYAQVRGADMSDPVRLAILDSEYLQLRGLILDAKIALATVLGKGSGDNTKISQR